MVRAAHLLRHLVAVTMTAKAIGNRHMVRSCCDIRISIDSNAIVYKIATVYLCSSYDGITVSAYCLSPNCSRLAALQNHSHLSAGELCCCLAFSLTSCICSVYASNRTFIFVVIAFGNCTRIFSTHATRITFYWHFPDCRCDSSRRYFRRNYIHILHRLEAPSHILFLCDSNW